MNDLLPMPDWWQEAVDDYVSFNGESYFNYESEQRRAEHHRTRAEAQMCDCWKSSSPLCARCALLQQAKDYARKDL